MAGEQAEALSSDLRTWVEQRAEETGTSPETVLVRALTAYRFLEGESEALADAAPPSDGDVEDLASRVDDVERRLETTEEEVRAQIGDMRDRVVQVKRETDGKAPADHDHPELADGAADAEERAAATAERVDDLERRVAGGFENYEEVLTYLTDATDDLDEKASRLANAVIDVRRTLVDVESTMAARAAADDLRREANRQGETRAACGECSGTVDLGLLSAPECPHCGATFDGLEPATGFFSTATLSVGDRPALEGATDPVEDASDLLEDGDE
jgi:hypothetical protein